jgi:hypothetical protein
MIQWGVNALNHGSSLAVFKDGELQTWTASHDDKFDTSTITSALHYGAPDRIFWYERPWVKKARQLYAGQYSTAMDLSVLPKRYLNEIRVHYAPVTYTPHHASHAAAGYYTSPFNHCAVVVLDAIGEFECATIWEGKYGEMKKVWSRRYPHSLGLFYSAFTQFLGLIPIRDEHLLQKMAEQGNPKRFIDYVRSYFNNGNTLELNTNFHRGVLHWDHAELTTLQEQCDLAAAVQEGKIDFDRCIATPDMMALVGRLGKILGPRNLMPNPKVGTVTMDVKSAVEAAKGGEVQFKVEKAGVIHAGVGKISFADEKLAENIRAFVDAVSRARPSGAKGSYLRKVSLSSTMGPGVSLDLTSATGN